MLMGLVSGGTASAGDIDVQISDTAKQAINGAGEIRVTLRNTSSSPLAIHVGATPFQIVDGKLPNKIFEVIADDGTEARYTGRFVKYTDDDENYVVLQPGEARSADVDLAKNYALKGGGYTVRYTLISLSIQKVIRGVIQKDVNAKYEEQTFSAKIWVNENLLGAKTLGEVFEPDSIQECDESKTAAINSALDAAKSMATDAMNYLFTNTRWDGTSGPAPAEGTFYPTARWNYWFGDTGPAYSPAPANMPTGYLPTGFITALYFAFSSTANYPILRCDACPGYSPLTAAVSENTNVVNQGNYSSSLIRLCPHFFDLPTNGTDSQAGTIIHEMTHFSQHYVSNDERPQCSPRAVPVERRVQIEALRRQRRTGRLIAQTFEVSATTVSRILRRAGLSRWREWEPQPPPRRYERSAPGELIFHEVQRYYACVLA
ncbi:hypothetical protein BV497_13155 [Fulvimonas soli]|jgi:hypothetical protein|nr:hypothetical protein BV497_13155 [Fulvimonas soli]